VEKSSQLEVPLRRGRKRGRNAPLGDPEDAIRSFRKVVESEDEADEAEDGDAAKARVSSRSKEDERRKGRLTRGGTRSRQS
jgi:hypothetical protein